MSLKHLLKSEFLTNNERERILDLPYDEASYKFSQILAKFSEENNLKASRELTESEVCFIAIILFEVFIRVRVYNSRTFWTREHIEDLIEAVIRRNITI